MKQNTSPSNDYLYTGLIGTSIIGVIIYIIKPYAIYTYRLAKYYYYNILFFLYQYWFLVLLSTIFIITFLIYKKLKAKQEEEESSVFVGHENKKPIYLSDKTRTTHAQVLGTTGSGKTESVIFPWIIQDLQKGNGVLIIDGKSDASFLDKLYSYTKKFNRKKDFKLFSLSNIDKSHGFNPLNSKSSVEIAEKVFSSFKFESEYYKNIQYKIFLNLICLIKEQTTPSFSLVHRLLTNMDELENYLEICKNQRVKEALTAFISLSHKEREERTSGLESQLSHFIQGEVFTLFEDVKDSICINEALNEGQIIYFQLPTMLYPFLAQATGRLVLQSLQSAVSRRHLSNNKQNKLFSVYLDDFQDYIYEGFGSLLNKSRSANIAMVFSHQSLGDLEKVSPAFRDVVLSNTNIKVIMRINDPATCEYFAKSFGTKKAFKNTERVDTDFLGSKKTGQGSLREAEEFNFHPNTFKQLPVGVGVVSIPERYGVTQYKLSLPMTKNLEPIFMPDIDKVLNKEVILKQQVSESSILKKTATPLKK